MKDNKKNKGITLIALVITIIILLILAGITIKMLVGSNGIIEKANEAKFKTKMSAISEEWSTYKIGEEIAGEEVDNIYAGELLKEIIVSDELEIEENQVKNIKEMIKQVGKTEEEYVIVHEGELYYVSQKKIPNNEKQVKWCEEIGIKIWEYEGSTGIKDTSGNYQEVNGVYVCTPELTKGFSKKTTRYITEREGKLEVGNWINKKPEDDWYDYKNRKWANIYVESNGIESYYVWIPRYVYKKDEENQTTGNERMDVKFVDCENNYIDATTQKKTSWDELQKQGYKLPEAFWWDNNGNEEEEGEERIPGYWISKYQLSELSEYTLDYSTVATSTSITIQNITVKTTETIGTYTYAINGTIVHRSKNGEDYTIKDLAKGDKTINVTVLDQNGEIIGSMTRIYEVADVNEPDISKFDKDTTFYVYWDEKGNEHNEIPIKNKAPSEWYDYTTANWANIVTRNDGLETYYVWIPRYEYKLDNTSERSYVKFIKGTSKETDEGYKIPEAFWWDNNGNGEEDEGEQISGYWITKYQLSQEEKDARINAEMSAGSNLIRIKDITGTLITEAETAETQIQYEYYLNGEKKHIGTNAQENYTYENLKPDTTYTVNIIARNKETDEYIGAVTKKIETNAPYKPDISQFNKDETYYVVYNDEGEEEQIKMSEAEKEPENWYDYSNQRWANIVTKANETETYFVWIPRYEYKILSDRGNLNTANRRIDVNFITTDITNENCTTGYKVPEAFWWDNNGNGQEEKEEELTGYWITKYQLSN